MAKTKEKQPLEALFKHTLELNKKYMDQGFKVLNDWSKQSNTGDKRFIFKPEQYNKVFHAFAKLNLEYYTKAMELGFGMLDSFVNNTPSNVSQEAEPAFIIRSTVEAGSITSLDFVLENTKTEAAQCELVNSNFINQENLEFTTIKTTFKPQKFIQEPGESHTVEIKLHVPDNIPPNTYISDVTVIGFEPSFFRIHVTVERPKTKPTHAKTKNRSTKKT